MQPGQDAHNYAGSERRSRQISEGEIKIIAEAAAEMAIGNLFEIFGVDVTTKEGRKGLQDDFTWVRGAREGTSALRKAGWAGALGTLATGLAFALWKGITVLGAAGARVGP